MNTTPQHGVTQTFAGALGGAGRLRWPAGTLALTNTCPFTGGSRVDAGAVLQIGTGGATGALTGPGDMTNNGELRLFRSVTLNQVLNHLPKIIGTGSVRIMGSGGAVFSKGNSYTGATMLEAGTLHLAHSGALTWSTSGYSASPGTTLYYQNSSVNPWNTPAAPVSISSATLLFQGNGGTMRYIIMPAGSPVTFSTGVSSMTVSAGTAGSGNASNTFLDGGLKGVAGAEVNLSAPTAGIGLVLRNSNTDFSGILRVGGIASVTPNAGSGLALGHNTSAPALQNAVIELTGTLELGSGSTLGWANTAVNGTTVRIGALTGSGVVVMNSAAAASRTLSIGNLGGDYTFTGTLADGTATGGAGVLSIVKEGAGIVRLNGGNLYTGTTAVNGGELYLGNTPGDGQPFSVASGATITFASATGSTVPSAVTGGGTVRVDTPTGLQFAAGVQTTGRLTLLRGSTTFNHPLAPTDIEIHVASVTPTTANSGRLSTGSAGFDLTGRTFNVICTSTETPMSFVVAEFGSEAVGTPDLKLNGVPVNSGEETDGTTLTWDDIFKMLTISR